MVPISFKKQLVPGSLEFAINELVDRNMNISIFDSNYKNDETGSPAYDPKILLKIVLLAYSRGIIFSRRIEQACRENVTFMAISCWTTPDHSTIAAFISSMKEDIVFLYRDILLVCEEEGLLDGTHFSLDGLKLSSNASKESSGMFSDLKIKQEKLEKKVKELVESHELAKDDEYDEMLLSAISPWEFSKLLRNNVSGVTLFQKQRFMERLLTASIFMKSGQ